MLGLSYFLCKNEVPRQWNYKDNKTFLLGTGKQVAEVETKYFFIFAKRKKTLKFFSPQISRKLSVDFRFGEGYSFSEICAKIASFVSNKYLRNLINIFANTVQYVLFHNYRKREDFGEHGAKFAFFFFKFPVFINVTSFSLKNCSITG